MFPLRLGSPEDFARVRAALSQSGFDDATVQRILRAGGQTVLGGAPSEAVRGDDSPIDLNPLLRLFVELKPVERGEVERMLDRPTLDAFLALDLLRPCGQDAFESPVFLYPVGGLLLVSDYYNQSMGADSVFPAIQTGTLHLLNLLPHAAAATGLDLCCGTGICGFALSRFADHVIASDVTDRAAHFAEFNRWLNGLSNVEIQQSDLYQSVEGRRFDRIVAHPPYVPNLSNPKRQLGDDSKIWRDGGATGDTITRRIVEGLPRHLNPGGQFLALCMGSDREDLPFQQRVREWLGDAESAFDIVCAVQRHLSPSELAAQLAGRDAPDQVETRTAQLEAAFRQAGAARFCFGALAIERHADASAKPWTLRTKLSPRTDGRSFEEVFRRSKLCSSPESVAKLRPLLAPGLKATVTNAVSGSKLFAKEIELETDFPFAHTLRLQPWVFPLLQQFSGDQTVSEVHALAAQEMPWDDFASLVAMLTIQGFLDYGASL